MVGMFVSLTNSYVEIPKHGGIRRWGLWEVMRSWVEWDLWLIKEAPERSQAPPTL